MAERKIPCGGIYSSQCGNLCPSIAHGIPPQRQTSHLPNHPSENARPPSQTKWTCIDYLRSDVVQRFNLSLKKVTMELKFFAVESVPYRVNTRSPQSHTGGLLSTKSWTFQASRSLLPRMDDLFEGVPRFNIFLVLVPPHSQYGSRSCLNNSCTAPDPKSAQNPFLLYLQHLHLATLGARLIPTGAPPGTLVFAGSSKRCFLFPPLLQATNSIVEHFVENYLNMPLLKMLILLFFIVFVGISNAQTAISASVVSRVICSTQRLHWPTQVPLRGRSTSTIHVTQYITVTNTQYLHTLTDILDPVPFKSTQTSTVVSTTTSTGGEATVTSTITAYLNTQIEVSTVVVTTTLT